MNPSEKHHLQPLASNASIKFKVKAGEQPTVSCGDIITDSDGDDSTWSVVCSYENNYKDKCVSCTHMKTSWDWYQCGLADIPVIMHLRHLSVNCYATLPSPVSAPPHGKGEEEKN